MGERAAVVVVGAGIVGAAVAYHLAQLGATDVLVLERGDVPRTPGSTTHAPGGVVAMAHDRLMARLSFYSTDLYRRLDPFDDPRNTYHPVGCIELARTVDRMDDLTRLHGEALAYGATTRLLDPAAITDLVPYVAAAEMEGGLFIPDSALISGANVAGALLRDAGDDGRVRVRPNTEVVDVEIDGKRVTGVLTGTGEIIETDQAVFCTNIWALPVGGRRIPLPLMAFQHQYVETPPILDRFDPTDPAAEAVYPTARDLDAALYFRHHWNRIGVGSYAHAPLAVSPADVGATADLPFVPEHFTDSWKEACRAVPILEQVESFTRRLNGMFAFTVDGMPIIGESTVGGLWLAVGSWITHAGGVGKATAEMMMTGESEWDLRQAAIDRFPSYATTAPYVRTVTAKNYRQLYDIRHPREPTSEPRQVRLSPFAPRLDELAPHNTTFAGIELASWYGANEALLSQYGDRIRPRSPWASLHWSPIAGAEHHACRENAALFDLTGLSIIEVTGAQALEFVDYLCSNRMDVAPGRVVYTTWLTPSAGVKRDLAVARLEPERFWMFVGEGTRPQDAAWVRRHAAAMVVSVADISDSYTALGLWGPRAQEALDAVTANDVSSGALGYFSGAWIDIGPAPVYAMRLSYVGEYGWELHMPVDQALGVFDRIWEAGSSVGMAMAGFTAMDSLRIEKGYRLWGADVHTEYDPYESGLGWTVRLDKGDFLGADACRRLAGSEPVRRLSCLVLESGDPLGNEAVFSEGEAVSYVTSAAFGHTIGQPVAYAYLPSAVATPGTPVEVLVEGQHHAATVAGEPLWDPSGKRMR